MQKRQVRSVITSIIFLKSVGVRKLQVAILARSFREMYQTVRIDWKHIMSRVRVSVRPRILLYPKKHQKPRGNQAASASVYFNGQRTALSPAQRAATVGRHRHIELNSDNRSTAATEVCMHACARMRMRVHACVWDRFAIYDNNI